MQGLRLWPLHLQRTKEEVNSLERLALTSNVLCRFLAIALVRGAEPHCAANDPSRHDSHNARVWQHAQLRVSSKTLMFVRRMQGPRTPGRTSPVGKTEDKQSTRPTDPPFAKDCRIAIIGAGPAGLTMAYELQKKGYTRVCCCTAKFWERNAVGITYKFLSYA